MSSGLPSRHALPDYLPVDALAQQLEVRGLWRRAEAIVQRQRYCLQQVPLRRQTASDGTAPGGDGMTAMAPLSGPDLWRTA